MRVASTRTAIRERVRLSSANYSDEGVLFWPVESMSSTVIMKSVERVILTR